MKNFSDEIFELEKSIHFTFPEHYRNFLQSITSGDVYEVGNTGIIFYSYSDLLERNETYEIQAYEKDFFMIGQDGDLAYFIKKGEDTIYSNDLGAIGSLDMHIETETITSFLDKYTSK